MDARVVTIAKETGVSAATVSRVLNGHPYVAKATRDRVLQAFARKSQLPRLRRSTDSHLTIVIEALNPRIRPLSSYTDGIINGAVELLFKRRVDMSVMVDHRKWLERRNLVKEFQRKKSFGALFLLPESGVTYLDNLVAERFPHIAIGRTGVSSNWVACDQARGIALALDHLRSQGHARIGFLGGMRGIPDHEARFNAYGTFMRYAGLYEPEAVVFTPEADLFKERRGYDEMLSLLAQAPALTAIVANDDSMALGAMRALRELGRRLPEDMAIVGFDNDEYGPFLSPSLTTVRQPLEEMGRFAAERLLEMSDTGFTEVHETFSPELIVRESSLAEPSAARDASTSQSAS